MLRSPLLIAPSSIFWSEVARAILKQEALRADHRDVRDLSALRVVVPTFDHAQQLKSALASELGGTFIPPRITTMASWLALQPPAAVAVSGIERLMVLYAALRQHAWLKKLFTARRNTDLLPLAQILLTLSDELTQALLPAMEAGSDNADARWQAALEQLSPTARNLLSDEAQLVWSIWKTQVDGNDAHVARYAQMMRLAQRADSPLVWISPIEIDVFSQAFLAQYGARQPVLPVMLDWRVASTNPTLAAAWREMLDDDVEAAPVRQAIATPHNLALSPARSLEDEALRGAQTIVDWLQAGKSMIAIIAQDRVVARRIRALLERAKVYVADETGWKLSTTRAAAVIAAWFEVITSRAETIALLDFLKSPFLHADVEEKAQQVMTIELALRSANVLGGWDAAAAALARWPDAQRTVQQIATQAGLFASRAKTLTEWSALTGSAMLALDMRAALMADAAGSQVVALLEQIEQDCAELTQTFSFAEWRAFVSLQLESTAFTPPNPDRRVVMLPLNGAHLRSFDAVLLVGADAGHLPSKSTETLFFANAVRRELGLATSESRQRQQLRAFSELLSANAEVVLSWQAHQDGEPNPISNWIERLQLTLARAGAAPLAEQRVALPSHELMPALPTMPAPAAAQLLPAKLSASGYNSLVACPYQFFATRMLGLSGLDELQEMPEKRDYGDWLHQILKTYHDALRDQKIAFSARENLLRDISEKKFGEALSRNAAALGYYARWQKVIPAYVTWANEHEAKGWHFVIGEEWLEQALPWDGGTITLHGRIDRIDRNDAGERAVLDYKTQNLPVLREKLKQREDHQLAFYGLLSGVPTASAHYVALEAMKDKTGDAEAPRYADWQQALGEQIKGNMQAIAHAAPLPATGIESVCQYCEVRGLCRKGAW